MVWSTTQSALYNDLSRYYEDDKPSRKARGNHDDLNSGNRCNNSTGCPDNRPEGCGNNSTGCPDNRPEGCGNNSTGCPDNRPEGCCNNSTGCPDNRPGGCGNNSTGCPDKRPGGCGNNFTGCPEKNPPVCANCPHGRQDPVNQISRMISEKISDKDMILIAGLIFLLIKQGADRKLILALAFVLLS